MQNGVQWYFRVHRCARLEKVFKLFSEMKGVRLSSLRFLWNGDRVYGHETAADLELKEGDDIDCLLEQIGGGEDCC